MITIYRQLFGDKTSISIKLYAMNNLRNQILAYYLGYIMLPTYIYMSQMPLQITGSRESEIIKHYENVCDSPGEIRLRVNIFSSCNPLMKEA